MGMRWFYSLKKRLTVALLLSAFIPLVLIGSISYYSITAIINNKIENSMQSYLTQVQMSLDFTMSNLHYVSQQLAVSGKIGNEMVRYLESSDILERQSLEKDILNNLRLIEFTNPNLGIAVYYRADTNRVLFEESMLPKQLSFDRLNKLMEKNGVVYYGPHRTMNRFIDRTVLSVTSPIDVPGYDDLYIYIETSFRATQSALDANSMGMNIDFLLLDQHDEIVYSENEEQFPLYTYYRPVEKNAYVAKQQDYYTFQSESNMGWTIVAAVREVDYNYEKNKWMLQFMGFAVLSLGVALSLAWFIWRSVNRPLNRINKEIRQLQQNNFRSRVKYTRIIEFDRQLEQFQRMRDQIWTLLGEVKQQEERRTELEIEKLLFQINPHFIHNTLDTIRWLAKSKGMHEIDSLIFTLNKVLYYNMGKGGVSTIQQEIDALNNYVSLQRIRYDFDFDVKVIADEAILHLPIPRFILQPLVENCLYHGLQDNATIEVSLAVDQEGYTVLKVADNGAGMSREAIEQLIHRDSQEKRRVGMGIGIYYVHRMMKAQYGDAASFAIESLPGQGTTMILRIPAHATREQGEQPDDKSVGRG